MDMKRYGRKERDGRKEASEGDDGRGGEMKRWMRGAQQLFFTTLGGEKKNERKITRSNFEVSRTLRLC